MSAPRLRPNPPAAFLAVFLFAVGAVALNHPKTLVVAALLSLAASAVVAGGLRRLRAALWVVPFGGALALVLPFVTSGGHPLATLHLAGHAFILTSAGLDRALVLLLRLTAAVLPVTAVTGQLGTSSLLTALEGLRVPPVFVSLIGFTLRYSDLLADESRRMLVARRARGFRIRRGLVDRRAVTTLGQLLGVLLLRARERAERVYLAMLSRGYRATSAVPGRRRPRLVAAPADALLLLAVAATAVTLILLDGRL